MLNAHRIIIVLFALFTAFAAHAEWKHTVSTDWNNKTSLKVVGPDDFTVTIEVAGDERSDTIPAIFVLPNEDAFVRVRVKPNDGGEAFNKKIEIKAQNQTTLTVSYTPDKKDEPLAKDEPKKADEPKAEKPKPRKAYIGQLSNTTDRCSDFSKDARFEFMYDGVKVHEAEVRAGDSMPNVELLEGHYKVRIYEDDFGFKFKTTKDLHITADGWTMRHGC